MAGTNHSKQQGVRPLYAQLLSNWPNPRELCTIWCRASCNPVGVSAEL